MAESLVKPQLFMKRFSFHIVKRAELTLLFLLFSIHSPLLNPPQLGQVQSLYAPKLTLSPYTY